MPMIEILNSGASSYSGYLAMPTGEDVKVPGIITIQHVFGVSREMQSLTSNFAENGYIALCPDLYWRIEAGAALEPTGPNAIQKAVAYALKLDTDQAVEDLKVAIEFLRSHPRCNGKVGTVGYCLGGFFAFLLAARAQENSDCNVGYFGVHIEKYLEEATHLSPLMLHIPEKDRYVPPDVQALIRQSLEGKAEVFTYPDADHAFNRIGAETYDAQVTALSYRRTAAFLKRHLGS